MKPIIYLAVPLLFLITGCHEKPSQSGSDAIRPASLRCEYLTNPVGIDAVNPRLSWISESNRRGQTQTAYRVIVSTTNDKLNNNDGDLWDSGKVPSNQSAFISYAGKALASGIQCFWKVKLWDKNGRESGWSEPSAWSMGLLQKEDWKAKWIGWDHAVGPDDPANEFRRLSARYLRKDFEAKAGVVRATAYICGLGLYELYLNGQKVGDHVLSPGLTEYSRRSLYVAYDVTGQIRPGVNAVGTILGNGRYFAPRIKNPADMVTFGFPKLLLQIQLEYIDGSTELIVSDESWKITANGPITENNEYDGEAYDARKEMPGWNQAGFDDSGWIRVELVEKSSDILSAQMIRPIRITQNLKPMGMTSPKPGVYIFDMGQNMVGWTRLEVKGEKGTVVKQRFAEVLKSDGTLDVDNMRSARVTDTYILKGGGAETCEPRFTYHGFRYVELTGFPGKPDLTSLEGKVVHDDLEQVGEFECSNSMINTIYRNATWGIRGNYRSMPTDCPQRDERQAWLGDRAAESRGESYIFDISRLYGKWLTDIFDSQKENGSISDVNPAYWQFFGDNVTWAGTPVFLVGMIYSQYGDKQVTAGSYGNLKKWVDYMIRNYSEGDLVTRDTYGDWCAPPNASGDERPRIKSDGAMIGSSYFYQITRLMEQYAVLLGKSDDAGYFKNLAAKGKEAFNARFFDQQSGLYKNNTVTTDVLALAFELAPEACRQKISDNMAALIESRHNGHIPTGLIGAQYLMRVLNRNNQADIAYRFATQNGYPGWGYMIEKGATTIWELWNSDTEGPGMNSRNHVMLLGDFITWLYEDLAGIKPASPGFKTMEMKPTIVGDLTAVKARHRSIYGTVSSEWEIRDSRFYWNITIPANTSAVVCIPAVNEKEVTENGIRAKRAKGVKFIKMSKNGALFEIGSGDYRFASANRFQ